MSNSTMTIHVDNKLQQDFIAAAEGQGDEVLARLMEQYVVTKKVEKAVARGRAAIKNGQVSTSEETEAYFDQKKQQLRESTGNTAS